MQPTNQALIEEFKHLLEAAMEQQNNRLQEAMDQQNNRLQEAMEQQNNRIQDGFERISQRMDEISREHSVLKQTLRHLSDDLNRKDQLIKSQTQEIERLKQHSYAYDILLHGIAESDNESWKESMSFFILIGS